jgi:hypothetical protein
MHMRFALASLLVLCVLPACALGFSAGAAPMAPPATFQDTDHSAVREERKKEETGAAWSPTIGLSLVVGGERMDAGSLPKPPVPVAVLR